MTMGIRTLAATLLLAGTLAAASPRAEAQAVPPPVVIVVDIQQIQQESLAYKAIQKQLDDQREVYQKEIAAQEEKLRAADQELARQRTILSPEAFAQKRREFEKQVAEIQRNVQTRKRTLDQAYAEAIGRVRKALLQIVADVAGERKANVVLARQQVLVVEESLDVTRIVMERLNEELPTVQVTLPGTKK